MICENYWFRSMNNLALGAVAKDLPVDEFLDRAFERVDCGNEAFVEFTPQHPRSDDLEFSRPRLACPSCLQTMVMQDELNRLLEEGTLFE